VIVGERPDGDAITEAARHRDLKRGHAELNAAIYLREALFNRCAFPPTVH
jgi:hypothetical protein